MSKRLRLIISSGILFFSGCITTEYNPATHRQDIFFYSTEREIRLGRNLSRAVEKKYKLIKEPLLIKRINKIGKRIIEVCERKEINYSFYLIEGKEKNAFSLPGGYVYLCKGLLDILESDDEIGFVLAHEVAHIVARHSIKRLQASLGYNLLLLASSQVDSTGGLPQGLSLILATIMSGYSQEDEFLADKLALKYMKKAGYNPEAGIKVLEKLEKAGDKEPSSRLAYFRTHPYIFQRIRKAKEYLGLPLEVKDILNF